MKRRPDPTLETLRRANPFPEESTAGWHASAEGTRVAAHTRAEESERPVEIRRRRSPAWRSRRPRLLVAAIVAAAVAFAIAGAFSLGPMKTKTPNLVACHNELRMESSFALVGLLGRNPVEACTEEWQHHFGEPAPLRLTTCVIREGGTAVYPYPVDMTPAEACSSVDAAVPEPSGP